MLVLRNTFFVVLAKDLRSDSRLITMVQKSAIDMLDDAIAELEARLNLKAGEEVQLETTPAPKKKKNEEEPKKDTTSKNNKKLADDTNDSNLPVICKMEFKVGVITKVWAHEKAEKLFCEEIDCGEATVRQIASGLRPHFTEDQMLGQRLLVVANLKAKNLVGFKSHGMVLCAAKQSEDGEEKVEFVEPPPNAAIGEIVTFEGLPDPQPATASQVDKKKIFQACMEGLKTKDDCGAAWNGHAFMTSAGPCKAKTIANGVMR